MSVEVSIDSGIATLTLNRPEALNAFDRVLARDLDAALRSVERDTAVRVVVITGAGRAFSAGQDVREMAAEEGERGAKAIGDQLRERFNPIVLRIRTLDKPVIASINGITTGAGLGIALASDLRIAAESASFVLSPMSIALIPGAGSTALLPALIGLSRATELMLLGERISAAQAVGYGIVGRVVPDDELAAETRALAERFAALPTRALGLTKRALNRAVFGDLAGHLAYEAELQEVAAGSSDHREGLAAVLEKRKPKFTGH